MKVSIKEFLQAVFVLSLFSAVLLVCFSKEFWKPDEAKLGGKTMSNKRGTANGGTFVMWAVVVLLAFIAYGSGFIPFLGASKGGTTGSGPGNTITVNVTGQQCNVDSTTLTIGNIEDFYSPSAKLTAWYHRWYLKAKGNDNWVDQGYVSDGTTRTVSPGDWIRVYYNLNGSATSHYPTTSEFEIPCVGAFTAATADDKYKDAYRLHNMTRAADVTATVWNQAATVNSASAPQALTAGQVRKMKFELQFPNKAAYGTPDAGDAGVLQICAVNSTYFDPDLFALTSGKAKYTGALPQRISLTSGFIAEAWEWPAQKTNGVITDTLVVDADDTVPATSTAQNVNCTFVDKSWYLPSDGSVNSGYPTQAYETNTQTDVGSVDLSILFRTNGTG